MMLGISYGDCFDDDNTFDNVAAESAAS